MPVITNNNYLICWTGPGSHRDGPNVFGIKVDAMREDVDVAGDGPLYRFTGGEGYERMAYEPHGNGRLVSTDGCCWSGWPGDISRAEHEKALLSIAIKVMSEGVPADLVLQEFAKIPVFKSMKGRIPSDVIGEMQS